LTSIPSKHMTSSILRVLVAALVCAAGLVAAPTARADGDPASDILTQQDVFYGTGVNLRSKAAAQLPALLERARDKGYDMKVALISDFQDLGVVTYLWKDPQAYADYLGAELSIVYKGRVLVVMPNGYGIYRLGHSTVRERRALDALPAPRRTAGFLPGALKAVPELAATQKVKLAVPDVDPPPGGVVQPRSHFEVGASEGNPTDVPPRRAPAATAVPAAAPSDDGGSGALLFLAPIAVVAILGGGLIVRGRRRSTAEPRA
jgi:hypothetical protein